MAGNNLMTGNPMLMPKCEVHSCNGEEGAKNYILGPSSSELVMDSTGPFVWYIETDENAQKKILTRFRVKQDDPPPPPDFNEIASKMDLIAQKLGVIDQLDQRLQKLEEALK